MPQLLDSQEGDLVPTVQGTGWAPGADRCGQVLKILSPLEFDPWTIHPVASHYTDYNIMAHMLL
jgi:hypothetical protein